MNERRKAHTYLVWVLLPFVRACGFFAARTLRQRKGQITMPTPRFYFDSGPEPASIGAKLVDAASHVRIDLWKTTDDELRVQFEISGGLNGDGEPGDAADAEDRRRAVGTIRDLVGLFAAKGGAR
jgi:hypothetical protein